MSRLARGRINCQSIPIQLWPRTLDRKIFYILQNTWHILQFAIQFGSARVRKIALAKEA
jgi:hypothetical protein